MRISRRYELNGVMECWSIGVFGRPRHGFTTPLLHYSITPSLHHSITPPLHHSTTPSLHHSITPPLHHSTTPSLHHSITPSLRLGPIRPLMAVGGDGHGVGFAIRRDGQLDGLGAARLLEVGDQF